MWMLLYNPQKSQWSWAEKCVKSNFQRFSGNRQKDFRPKCCDYISAEKNFFAVREERRKNLERSDCINCAWLNHQIFSPLQIAAKHFSVLINHRVVPTAKQTAPLAVDGNTLRAEPSSCSSGVNRKYPEENDGYIIRHTRIEFLNYKCCAYYIITEKLEASIKSKFNDYCEV